MFYAYGNAAFLATLDDGVRLAEISIEKILFPNGGFEKWTGNKPDGYTCSPPELMVSRDTKEVFAGESSMRVAIAKESSGTIAASAPVSGKKFSLSLRARLEAQEDKDIFVMLVVTPLDASGKPLSAPKTGPRMGSQRKWMNLKIRMKLPKKTVKVRIEILLQGSGKVWLDELTAEN